MLEEQKEQNDAFPISKAIPFEIKNPRASSTPSNCSTWSIKIENVVRGIVLSFVIDKESIGIIDQSIVDQFYTI